MTSTCVKCGGHNFEVALFTPFEQSYKLQMVQCASCGTPVGVFDPSTDVRAARLSAQVASIDERLGLIARALAS